MGGAESMINFPIINEEPLERDILTGKPVGALKAAGMGVLKAGVDVGGFLAMSGAGIEGLLAKGYEAIGFEESADNLKKRQENFYKFYEDYIKPAREYLTPDPALTSLAGKVLHGVGNVVPLLLTGEAALPLLVGSSTMNTGAELAEQGVDATTATVAAIGSGITTAAMIKLPASGKKLWQTLGFIAANPAIGAGQRKALKEVLEAEGYKEAAKAYDPLDPTALAIDTVLGIFFGGMSHYGRARAKMPIEVEDAIDTAAAHQKNLKDTPFENTYKNNRVNLAAKDKAIQDITEGKPVDVSEQIAEMHSTETITPEKKQAWQMTKEEALQNASVNRYGRTEIGGVEPDYTVGMLQKKAEFSPEAWIENGHKRIIYKALEEGKPVPEEVLKGYPEIQEILRKMGPLKPSMPFKKTETPETIEARKTATDAINELHDTVDEVARLNGMEPEIVDMEQGSPEWLELRLGKRMASETPAVLGLSPFMKPTDLWAYKTGRKQFVETPAMTHGKLNEGYARDSINQIYHTKFKPSVMMKGEFGASLDGISPDGKTVLEVKVPYGGKESQTWKEAQSGKIPEHYRAQLQHQLMISGADEAWFVVYDRKIKHHLRLVEKPDPVMQKKITDAWDKFWPHIAEDRPLIQGKSPLEQLVEKEQAKMRGTLTLSPDTEVAKGVTITDLAKKFNAGEDITSYLDEAVKAGQDKNILNHNIRSVASVYRLLVEPQMNPNNPVILNVPHNAAQTAIMVSHVKSDGYLYRVVSEKNPGRFKSAEIEPQQSKLHAGEKTPSIWWTTDINDAIENIAPAKGENPILYRIKASDIDGIGENVSLRNESYAGDLSRLYVGVQGKIPKSKIEAFDLTEKLKNDIVKSGGKYDETISNTNPRGWGLGISALHGERSGGSRSDNLELGRGNREALRSGPSKEELKPYISLKRPVKLNTVVEWVEKQGKINYNKEHFKGELDLLAEKDPRFKSLISKKDKGLTLDELAIRAKDEGFIKEADPQELLAAIEKRKMRIADEEDFLAREMEYNKPILNLPEERIVEKAMQEGNDIAILKADEQTGEFIQQGSMKEEINRLKEEYRNVKQQEVAWEKVSDCLRMGG